MSNSVLLIGVVAIVIAVIVAYAYIQSRPQKTWLGQLVDDVGGPAAIAGAFA